MSAERVKPEALVLTITGELNEDEMESEPTDLGPRLERQLPLNIRWCCRICH